MRDTAGSKRDIQLLHSLNPCVVFVTRVHGDSAAASSSLTFWDSLTLNRPLTECPWWCATRRKQRIRVRDRGPGVLTGHAAAQRGTARPRCAPSPFCSLGRFTCFLSFLAAKPKRIESSLTSPLFFFFPSPPPFHCFFPSEMKYA